LGLDNSSLGVDCTWKTGFEDSSSDDIAGCVYLEATRSGAKCEEKKNKEVV